MSHELSFPRALIKWLQSLNLSCSIKDLRRDLVNGYVIAEIISIHQKNVVVLPSYSNSHSTAAKKDNWLQLEKVFQKIGFEVKNSEYSQIKDGNLNQLIVLMTKLCKFLANKTIEVTHKRKLVEGKTKTYLLTETGLENINLENRVLSNDYKLIDKPPTFNKDNQQNSDYNEQGQSVYVGNQAGFENNYDVAFSRTDLLQMMEQSDKGSEVKNSVGSFKNVGSRKDLNFIMRGMDKSRTLKNGQNVESRFSGKRSLISTGVRTFQDETRRQRKFEHGPKRI
jgi:hypothetical protein